MCGINGYFSFQTGARLPGADSLRTVRDTMRARGPDSFGEWFSASGETALGHRRLAIIDLSEHGAQPMASDDGRHCIVFNGEIYNYRELREELLRDGIRFQGHSDTEVLLHLYRKEGEAMLARLRGMFAFAIWDEARHSLFLARDPYGIKPLYYTLTDGVFQFASQVRALLAGGVSRAEVSPGGLVGFLLWGSVPEPLTFYRGILALPAGHCLTVDRDGPGSPRAYWRIGECILRSMDHARSIPKGQEIEALREALTQSVRAHLVADVPVGAFLSGGLDSSVLVGLAKEIGQDIQSFTVTAEEFKGNHNDEAPHAAEIAHHIGVPHRVVNLSMNDAMRGIPAYLAEMDQPTVDGINTWFVTEATRQAGLKVVLSGLGGDELLGGYATFDRLASVESGRIGSGIPGAGMAYRWGYILLAHLLGHYPARGSERNLPNEGIRAAYEKERGLFMPWELPKLLQREILMAGVAELERTSTWEPMPEGLNSFGKVALLESSRYMRNQLLRDSDWVGMAHSLELRTPLVDHRLTEQIIGLAAAGRLGPGKSALGLVLRNGLPEHIKQLPKKGFTLPIWTWLYKLEQLQGWKRNAWLKRKATSTFSRWGYAVLDNLEEARPYLL